jgi:LysM repeat protein
MNTTNPFQVPTCLQRADLQLRRRERFRRGVVVAVAAVVTLLVVLLIEGCMSEHANTSNTNAPAVTGQLPDSAPGVAPKAAAAPVVPHGFVGPKVAPTLVSTPTSTTMPVAAQPAQVYVIKTGDTLTRIARQHHTTVKALKAANNLDTDSIAVGAMLKLPSA